jgi:hypothetical protein
MIVEEERIGMVILTRVNSTGTGNLIRISIAHLFACFGTKSSKRSRKTHGSSPSGPDCPETVINIRISIDHTMIRFEGERWS